MQKEKPVGCYKWCTEISSWEILSTPADSVFGFFVEVDLAYPAEVKDVDSDLPLAPGKIEIPTEWRYDYAKPLGLIVGASTEKLVEILLDKAHYSCHYKNLKFYFKHGLRVKNLQRVVEFLQSKWLGIYFVKSTKLRKQASNNFEKNFSKPMSNACFGKTLENLRRRGNMQFITTKVQAGTYVQRAPFTNFEIFSDELVSVSFSASSVILNKPTSVAATISNPSKLSLKKCHDEEVPFRYGSHRTNVVSKDTDSLLYRIQTNDL